MSDTPILKPEITEDYFRFTYKPPIEGEAPFTIIGYYHSENVYVKGIPYWVLYSWLGPFEEFDEAIKVQPRQEFTRVLIERSLLDANIFNVLLQVRPGYNFFEADFTGFNSMIFGRYERNFIWA